MLGITASGISSISILALLHGARLVTAEDRILTCLGTLRASEKGHGTVHS
jgi:hypothetical protein